MGRAVYMGCYLGSDYCALGTIGTSEGEEELGRGLGECN
jgi:hypothetical protein